MSIINIKSKYDCCGCSSCQQVCPKGAISMSYDAEGFSYPVVDYNNCVRCGTCVRSCPTINSLESITLRSIFAYKNRDVNILKGSSSGGLFYDIAEHIIRVQKGVVFGVKLNEQFEVTHSYTDKIGGVYEFMGSKYVQSNIGNSYLQVKEFLSNNRVVLFSGTPCQVAGLKRFLRRDYGNLLCVDFICHGVPSPAVWGRYIKEEFRPQGDDGKNTVLSSLIEIPSIEGVSFRDKLNGWKKYGFALYSSATKADENSVLLSIGQFKKGKLYRFDDRYKNFYMRGFLNDLYLRPSCHKCAVRNFKSGSDLTIGDFWGVEEIIPHYNDEMGVSIAFSKTLRSEQMLKVLNDTILPIDLNLIESIITHNPAIRVSPKRHKNRTIFFKHFNKNKKSFKAIIEICLPPATYLDKVMWSISKRIKNLKS